MSAPVITNVSWTADNLPSGVTFDSETGVFSGTPATAGEYIVPVSVTTDYGSDTKDVSVSVERGKVIYTFTVQAENSAGVDQKQFTITVWRN